MSELVSNSTPKFHVETWGCQMNVADSEEMISILQNQNFKTANSEADADLIILNTCHIREKATQKVLSRLGRLDELKKQNPKLKIAVTGCVAQAEAKRLAKANRGIDIILSPGKISEIHDLYNKSIKSNRIEMSVGFHKDQKAMPIQNPALKKEKPTIAGKNSISRFVNIAQGCNNFCTFCVVPFTRGKEVSKMPATIVEEVKAFLTHGTREITLLGQNVNSYGLDLLEKGLVDTKLTPFVDLLKQVAGLDDLYKLRFTTSNPHDFSRELADLFLSEPKLGNYLHLPVQSGSDTILKSMKRKVTVAEYYERVDWIRSVKPDFAISTDLIVGFPGESDEDFQQTLDLVKKMRYCFVYAFKYSSRKNTAAARFRNQIEESVKTKRLQKLNEIQDVITSELNQAEVGKQTEMLVTYRSDKYENTYYGRTNEFRLTKVVSNRDIIGQSVNVEIIKANKTALEAKLI